MTARATPTVDALSEPVSDTARLYQEGMIAGVIGAIAVAVWFLLLDTAAGHPFYTPTVLGTAIFRRSALASPETLSVSLEISSETDSVSGEASALRRKMAVPSTVGV